MGDYNSRKYPKHYYWNSVPEDADVELVGKPGTRFYVVNGDGIANWSSYNSDVAQRYLDGLVEATKKRKEKEAKDEG